MHQRSIAFWIRKCSRLALAAFLLSLAKMSPLEAATIYVDHNLTNTALGTYSIVHRNATGQDGTAYPSIVEAANVAKAGDTVLIRAGSYHSATSASRNDVLWPKHSGTPGNPITFRPYGTESVILGGGSHSYPDDTFLSISRGVVTMTNVNYITIEGLQFKGVAGWLYGRHCQHITFTNDVFADAYWSPKNVARLIDSKYCSFVNCAFTNGYDTLSLNACDYTTVLNCSFSTAEHTLLALRSCNYTVVRNCNFRNPYYVNARPEKLVEVYDFSLDNRDPANPSYIPVPLYNDTKRNLFESNYFGYFPANLGNVAAQPAAMEYSGQNGIIRRNVFSNPPLETPDPKYPAARAGGYGIFLAYGGSWTGWDPVQQQWIGQGDEAGYVTHNRFFNNVFYGYDNGCINTPSLSGVAPLLNPPPMYQTNPTEQYALPYQFADNIFLNNIISPGIFQNHVNWTWQQQITGLPVGLTMLGDQPDGLLFLNNDFYAQALQTPALVSLITSNSLGKSLYLVGDASVLETNSPQSFDLNLEIFPTFVNPSQGDFRLQAGSPLLGAGAFLTVAKGSATAGTVMQVQDAGYFYDGFGIAGEVGDLIQLEGQTNTARILHIDYDAMILTLDRPMSWHEGQGVSQPFSGPTPDIGLGLPPLANAPPLKPLAAANPAVVSGSVSLMGSATANRSATTVYFQYGTTTNYGSHTAFVKVGSGSTPVSVTNVLTNLKPATTYHFQFVATNSIGKAFSPDQVFTTAAALTNLLFSTVPMAHTNVVGTSYTFSAGSTSSVGAVYQWRFNGVNLPQATNKTYVVRDITPANGGTYSVVASTPFATGSKSAVLTVSLDLTPPAVTIATPAAGLSLATQSFTATGSASDNGQVTGVSYSVNGAPFRAVTTTNAWKNWTAVLDGAWVAGSNVLAVQAKDFSGNLSPVVLRNFIYAVPSPLIVLTVGAGTLSTNLNGQLLNVGQNYSVTALPAPGYVFASWLVGGLPNLNRTLNFTMQANLVLTAIFVPSPFTSAVAGTYNGLFFETNAVSFPSSGLLTLTVDTNGGFNGQAYLAGASVSLNGGLFDSTGHAQMVVSRAAQQKTNLLLDLQVDLTGATQAITGTVSSVDGAWSSALWAPQAGFGPANPTTLAGKYTFAIPGGNDPATGPVGDGYGTLNLSTNGTVALTGNLGDGTRQIQALSSVSISAQGWWPLYEPLYSGGGAVLGWINFNNLAGVVTNVSGSVVWTKLANPTNALFPAGFTNRLDLTGSSFAAPAAGTPILAQPVTQFILTGADLATPLTNGVTLTSANALQFSPNPYSLKVGIVSTTGLFTGTFLNPATGLTNSFGGTLLQNQNAGFGNFISTNSTGSVLLQ